ncbi:MAG: isochorismatase family protein [Deltaproteobacteria bacterium]|nr:isochorismatase family protein [Deltaproteobacteria bacterium]
MSKLALTAERSGLLVIDFQERLIRAMPPERAERATRNTLTLLEAARRLRVPVVVSEQYPTGLGPTISPVSTALAAMDPPVLPLTKLHFSAMGDKQIQERVAAMAVDAWIVAGMETHVCVYQTVRDLVGSGSAAHVVADACLSRTEANWERGLDLMTRAGAVVTSTEVVVFDLLKLAGTEDFKALSKLVR